MKPFDLQVNGYAGVDFNSPGLESADLRRACQCLRDDGVGEVLATVITDGIDAMCAKIARLAKLRENDPLAQEIIAGFHIEGPFISGKAGFVGAHPVAAVQPAQLELMKRLLHAGGGLVRLVTLAPEEDAGFVVTRFLAEQEIVVSAGHSDAGLDALKGAIQAGLSMFTHVGNGCPVEMHRHDNIVQRALSLRDDLWMCFIPDGWHVPFPALRNYLRCAGLERSIMVTDAIAAARLGPGNYTIGDQQIDIGRDGIAWAADGEHFAGSTITMPRVLRILREELRLGFAEVELLTAANPRAALGLLPAGGHARL